MCDNILTGKGDQYWMTQDYEDKRLKALVDRTKYDGETLHEVDVSSNASLGGGMTDDDTYIIKQFPFPTDQSIRRRKEVDLREVDPTIGGGK